MSGLEILWLQCKWFLNKNKSYAKRTELSAPQSNTANVLGCLKINCWLNARRPERSLYSSSGSPSAHKTTLKSPMPVTFDVCPPNTYITKASEKLWMTILLRNFSKLVKPAHNAKPHRDLTAVECFTTSLMCICWMHIKWMNEWNEFLHILFLENAIKSLLNCKQSCN